MLFKSLTKYDTDLFYLLHRKTLKRDCRSIIWLSKTGDGYLYFVIGMLLWGFEQEHGEYRIHELRERLMKFSIMNLNVGITIEFDEEE